ncbi:MAG: helix-turn-helix transcriptional regulator, partial [Lachnospiraceae bacterium]|nr:helix-turn-helix transcriptional regulator [Lachnospiraceae bacterium]
MKNRWCTVDKKEFSERLSKLRLQKGISARDMSLSLGQSPSYINNIENGV